MQNPKPALVVPSRDLEELIEKTRNFMRGATSPATVRAYRSDFADFVLFCREHNLSSLPAEQAKIKTGPVFRRVDRYGFVSRTRGLDPASVAYIVKQAARRAGFRHVRDVSGHSFRSGHVSQAVRNGVPEYVVMKQTGHKSREVLAAYIRKGELFEQNAAGGLWAA